MSLMNRVRFHVALLATILVPSIACSRRHADAVFFAARWKKLVQLRRKRVHHSLRLSDRGTGS